MKKKGDRMAKLDSYFSKNKITMVPLNRWDFAALVLILSAIVLLAIGLKGMSVPYYVGETIPITLDPSYLPYYALRTVLRMFIALALSLLFTFIFGTWAAKSKRAEQIIIPAIDILQSVPVLGFLSITVVGFINLFHGSLLGPECAAIFAIFTAQAWNIALSFYQSLRSLPHDILEAADILQLSAWQRFWRIEVPFAMPGLLWNTMMSMSASWFFVVASEAISVANQRIWLPGVGSYIAEAIKQADFHGVIYAIVAMFIVILIYDQLLFRPLMKWAEKFKTETIPHEIKSRRTWVTKLLQQTKALKLFSQFFSIVGDRIVNFPPLTRTQKEELKVNPKLNFTFAAIWYVALIIAIGLAVYVLLHFILTNLSLADIGQAFLYGGATALRVFAVIIFCTLVWVPLGVWIGFRPRVAQYAQPVMQFLASFPAYLLFPLVVIIIVKFHLNVQVWVTPLMILGTQWYVAFNVIAGTMAIPKDLHLAIDNFGVSGWLKWTRFIIPGIFPYYVTGAITAVGGAWNTSIVAEIVSWGNITLKATGLGAYITQYTTAGDYPRIALGICVMCIYVLVLNRVIWRPLYLMANRRFRMDY